MLPRGHTLLRRTRTWQHGNSHKPNALGEPECCVRVRMEDQVQSQKGCDSIHTRSHRLVDGLRLVEGSHHLETGMLEQ